MSEPINPGEYKAALADAMKWKERYRKAAAEIETIKASIAERDSKIAELESGLDDVLAVNDDYEKQLGEYGEKLKNAEPVLAQRIKELETQIRERDYHATFEKLAKDKIRPDALEAARKLAGQMPDGEFNEETISGLIEGVVSANPFLAPAQADPAASGSSGAALSASRGADASGKPTLNPAPPGPGVVRGSASAGGSSDPAVAAFAKLQSLGAAAPDGAIRLA
jgi:hypothetical protein